MAMKVCKVCLKAKPADPQHFVRNRPNYSRGIELPRTYHDTCKACESKAKTAAWVRRKQADKDYQEFLVRQQLEAAKAAAKSSVNGTGGSQAASGAPGAKNDSTHL